MISVYEEWRLPMFVKVSAYGEQQRMIVKFQEQKRNHDGCYMFYVRTKIYVHV